MASGGRRGAGERVLEGKHVIGLFMLMLLFSGVFFSLGYVMGRNQYDGQVRAATTNSRTVDPEYVPKAEPSAKKTLRAEVSESATQDDSTVPDKSGWESYEVSKPGKSNPQLDPAPKSASVVPPVVRASKVTTTAVQSAVAMKTGKVVPIGPMIPAGSILLQVAALSKQDDALAVAGSLRKKHFDAYVAPPQKDKLYRVQVGPFKDQKTADATKKGLESAGFKAFPVKH